MRRVEVLLGLILAASWFIISDMAMIRGNAAAGAFYGVCGCFIAFGSLARGFMKLSGDDK